MEYTAFSVVSSFTDNPEALILEETDGTSLELVDEWREDPGLRQDPEQALDSGYRGFQIVSADRCGRRHLEGIALYAERELGIYLRALETAPWNRKDGRFRGIATVLVARIALESMKLGFDGTVYAIPTSLSTERFNVLCGFMHFREYARQRDLSCNEYPLGYECAMVLDSSRAKILYSSQMARRGNVAVKDRASSNTILFN